jgi:hypothetical protein
MGGNCLLSIEALNKTASSKSIGPCPAVMDSAFGGKSPTHIIPSPSYWGSQQASRSARFCEFKDWLSCTIFGLLDDPRYCPSLHPGCAFPYCTVQVHTLDPISRHSLARTACGMRAEVVMAKRLCHISKPFVGDAGRQDLYYC